MRITVATGGILSHKAGKIDCVVVGVPAAGGRLAPELAALDKRLGGVIATCCSHKDVVAATGLHMLPLPRTRRDFASVLLVVGPDKKSPPVNSWRLQGQVAGACHVLAKTGCASALLHLDSLGEGAPGDAAWLVRQVAQACASSAYKFKLGFGLATRGPKSVTLLTADGKASPASLRRALRVGSAIGEGMRLAKHLGEQPPNILYPESLARNAASIARKAGLKAEVLDHAKLAKLRMGGLLGVGQGSAHKPRLLVLRHQGGRPQSKYRVLVGKGITFDTGGNSIKPSGAMLDMKFDMCGAAVVIGAMLACARMRLPANVAAVVPTAENMVAGNSLRPDDIIRMMDGTQVEVLNTDAEGRLILADAITYAQRVFKPDQIVDAATLTGACLVALGQHRAGLCASDKDLAAQLQGAGEDSADPCWDLPMDHEYDKLLDSNLVGFANIGGGRNAGTITAACFIKRFVKVKQWAHLDVAGTAWRGRRATGRPVPALATWLARAARLVDAPE